MAQTQIAHMQCIGCNSNSECRRAAAPITSCELHCIFASMSRYLKHIPLDLLRLQARANEGHAIEVAAWNLGASLTNET